MLRCLGLTIVLAAPVQDEPGMSRGAKAMLDAAIRSAESAPDSVDSTLVRRMASFKNRPAFAALRTLLRSAERASTRALVLAALTEFAGTEHAAEARELLAAHARNADSALETDKASVSLRSFGPEGLELLRAVTAEGQSFHARLNALLQLAVAEQPTDLELLAAVARDDWRSRLQRLGLPPEDPDWQERYSLVRRTALRSWARLSRERGSLPETLLQDGDPEVQAVALETTADRDLRRAVLRALAILSEEEPGSLKRGAIDVLRRLNTEDAVRRILEVARSSAPELHGVALQALETMDVHKVLNEALPLSRSSADRDDALLAIEVLARHPSAAVDDGLERLLAHREPIVRSAALRTLGERGAREASDAIKKQTRARDPQVRASAIVAYSRLNPVDRPWREHVDELASSRDALVRIAAARSLAFFSDRTTLPTLEALAADADWRVRTVAVGALGKLRSASSIPFLVGRLSVERRTVREHIGAALRRISAVPLGDTNSEWTRWWQDAGAGFVVPPLHEFEEMERRRVSAASMVRTAGRFYGIPVTSDHVALVVDVSGSMSTPILDEDGTTRTRLEVAKGEIIDLLERLPSQTNLQLVHFSSNARAWKRRLVSLDAATAAEARAAVGRWSASGNTNLFDAVQLALRDPSVDTLYVLSDGYPTTGKLVQPVEIREEIRRCNAGGALVIHTVSIGMESDLLRWLAEDSGGTHVTRE